LDNKVTDIIDAQL